MTSCKINFPSSLYFREPHLTTAVLFFYACNTKKANKKAPA
nr:MAG TPA: hypothetical protein [Caudoviricetes sp.]